jgi:hypothetical protein
MRNRPMSFVVVKDLIGLKPPYLMGLLLFFLQQSALADIWAFVDDRGVTHMASEQLDARYQLFSRGHDTSVPVAPPMPERVLQVQVLPPLNAEPAGSVLGVSAFFERSPAYRQVLQQVREASAQHDIEHELLQALIATESGFDTSAVSPKGAVGLMQVLPATAARFGVAADRTATIEKKLMDPRINLATGSRYLRHLFNLFPGQLELALAAYNAGEGAVQVAGNAIPNFLETKNYVNTVMQIYRTLKPAAPVAAPPPPPEPPRTLAPAAPVIIRGGALNRGNMMPSMTAPLPRLASPATP